MRPDRLVVALLAVTWATGAHAMFAATAAALALSGLAALKGAALVGIAASLGQGRFFERSYADGNAYGSAMYGLSDDSSFRRYSSYPTNRYGASRQYSYPYAARRRLGRSVEAATIGEGERLLLFAAGHLDTNGCIFKLLCHLQAKEESRRTPDEHLLVSIFNSELLSSFGAAFARALDVGRKAQDSSECTRTFPNCPLAEADLADLLQQAWGCGPTPQAVTSYV
ncbi:uncharacterized protein LOC125027588 [Penaeus chinensis]|uniref:uncharacterized protein LOC125027588 n=1 Tax=Penaeus chinensis TaxID=139456 RepID=UPI001FB609ED|nr:uncharacterized protein LOC125027588 [Penaeus chinensis]